MFNFVCSIEDSFTVSVLITYTVKPLGYFSYSAFHGGVSSPIYLDPIDAGSIRASTPVYEEQHFPSDALEICRNVAHLRAEIQH